MSLHEPLIMPRIQGASTNGSLQKTISRPKRVREDTVAPHAPVPHSGPLSLGAPLAANQKASHDQLQANFKHACPSLLWLLSQPQPLSSALSQGWQPNLDEAEATRRDSYSNGAATASDTMASSEMGRILLYRLIVYTLHHQCLDDSDSYSASDVAIWTRGHNL
ncbi:hypothetical protein BHE90_010474 [Fusarium euwallaceae]|uniref:Uncharacterized protein n=1 Tax=Fusarium euwallaceae TaxID=1147111 RepID=A0A430LH90_9HYPO|nr:hypothetical protein BHE90_010474 [Fusarium euwallaceae]